MAPKSKIWNHFIKNNEKSARCKHCNAVCATSGNTSNLWLHLNKCKDCPTKEKLSNRSTCTNRREIIQPTLEECQSRKESFKEGSVRSTLLDDDALYMLVKDNLSLSEIENPGFRRLLKRAVPFWKPPSRAKITRNMEQKYFILSETVKNRLASIPSLCLTIDCWTESHNTTSFLGVTIHYAIQDKMESIVAGVEQLKHSHTNEYLSLKILEFCKNWEIVPSKVSSVVTDNAPNAIGSAKLAFGDNKHICCFAHTLNLIPSAALGYNTKNKVKSPNVPGIPDLINKVKSIVTYSHNSQNFANELTRIQTDSGKSIGSVLRLPQDVPTRWNSTYIMLDRFLQMKTTVAAASLNFTDLPTLTAAEFSTLDAVRSILHPFYELTIDISSEKTSTLSKVIPAIKILTEEFASIEVPANDGLVKQFKTFILGEMDRRFKDVEFNMLMALATLLDPRFLKIYFSKPLAVSKALTLLEQEIVKGLHASKKETETQVSTLTFHENCDSSKKTFWRKHIETVNKAAANLDISDDPKIAARAELKAYFARPPSPFESNPLTVWESLSTQFPNVYKLARIFVPALATSVPSERLFSLAGRIMTDERNRLTPNHLSQRIFLQSVDDSLWPF